jgi:hypothetical protein
MFPACFTPFSAGRQVASFPVESAARSTVARIRMSLAALKTADRGHHLLRGASAAGRRASTKR